MKKIIFANIFLAAFLLAAGPALAAGNQDLDITMQLMGAKDRNPDAITNQIELPERQRIRTQARLMDGEQSGEMNQIRTQTRTQERQHLLDTSRTQMQEQRQQTIMDNSRPRSFSGAN